MSGDTKIQWTDKTWNPIVGCSVVSAGCTNCYAMKFAGQRLDGNPNAPHYAGTTKTVNGNRVWTGKVAQAPDHILMAPLKWRKPAMVFVNSMGDLGHPDVPFSWLDPIFTVMALSPQHTYQILTKRPERLREYLLQAEATIRAAVRVNRMRNAKLGDPDAGIIWPLPNVWLGVSIEDQKSANARIPELLATPAAIRWASIEPLLDCIDLDVAWHGETALAAECWGDCAWCSQGLPALHNCQRGHGNWERGRSGLDWVVVGGESGPGARPMHPDWARLIRDQCASANVPFFFKQWGAWRPPLPGEDYDTSKGRAQKTPTFILTHDGNIHCFASDEHDDGQVVLYVGKKAAGDLLDGAQHHNWPLTKPETEAA